MTQIAQFKKNLISLINSYDTSVPRGYNKEEAFRHIKRLRLIAQLAQELEFPNMTSIAKAFNTTTTTLYSDYQKLFGTNYMDGLNKYEIIIRARKNTGFFPLNTKRKLEKEDKDKNKLTDNPSV